MSFEVKRVLLIQLKRVGDVLLCTPLVRALRADRPEWRITFLTEEQNRPILQGNRAIDAVLTIPARIGVRDWWRISRAVRQERPDCVIDLSGTPGSCLLAVLSGAPVRVGFHVRLPRRWAYNHVVIRDPRKYTVDRRLDLLRAIGVEGRGFATELFLEEGDHREAARVLAAAGFPTGVPLLAIAPTSRKGEKRWSPEGFARVADRAREELGLEILLLHGPAEEAQAEGVRGRLPGGARRLPEVPSLRVLAALIERSRILLANDGGPKHLAVALGIPTVTVFVSTSPASWHPPDDPIHVAVQARGDLDGEVEEVLRIVRGRIERHP